MGVRWSCLSHGERKKNGYKVGFLPTFCIKPCAATDLAVGSLPTVPTALYHADTVKRFSSIQSGF